MLRFCFGPSGCGKSNLLYREVIEESLRSPQTQFFIIVPDQFTMQVQRDVVRMHPAHGIMNIDVLSFSRLRHRIFDEMGEPEVPILDDMGKTLVLRHVAGEIEGSLPLIGARLRQPGFIDEIKSILSEFLQYRISPEDLEILMGACGLRGQLALRLRELQTIYRSFNAYIAGHFLTAEESMGVLADKVLSSGLLRDAMVVFDGFTGFTPIQYQVLSSLFQVARQVTVSLVMDPEEDPFSPSAGSLAMEDSIFALSRKAAADLERAAFEAELRLLEGGDVPDFTAFCARRRKIAGDIYIRELPVRRLADNPPLAFLERHLYRGLDADGRMVIYEDSADARDRICLTETADPEGECAAVCREIRGRLRDDPTLCYGDMAVLCTDMEIYGPLMEREMERYELPLYLDRTGGVTVDPLVECLESALEIVRTNYAPAAVFRFLRCPLAGREALAVDRLELYVDALGIRGRRRYEEKFLRTVWQERSEEEQAALLDEMNGLREWLRDLLAPLFAVERSKIIDISRALIALFEALGAEEKLHSMAAEREAAGDVAHRREYEQIYGKIIDLVDQMVSLLGEERVTIKEYAELMRVGIDKISIGRIPRSMDRVMVGDLERTRLGEKRMLFLVGVNDSLLPRSESGGGFLSEIDRQFLAQAQTQVELAPGPGEKLSYEREYLYMNLTKPSEALWLSWSLAGMDGRSERPADLIRHVRQLFPHLSVRHEERNGSLSARVETEANALHITAAALRDYADAALDDKGERELMALWAALAGKGRDGSARERLEALTTAAFLKYQPLSLSADSARALYGPVLENSVSRLELFSGCPYAHYARYGLGLKEEERFVLDVMDLGNLYHAGLESFDRQLNKDRITWRDLTRERADEIVTAALEEHASTYRNQILLSNNRYRYSMERMRRILMRSVDTMRYQILKGKFLPTAAEWDFRNLGSTPETDVRLPDGTRIRLQGRIDRMDTCEEEGQRFLRIIDYKSGSRDHDPALLYHGLQLQLMLYLRVAARWQRQISPDRELIPAGVFYYRIFDPMLSGDNEKITSDTESLLRKKLALSGIANADAHVLHLMDRDLGPGIHSDILPVAMKKDGAFTASSHVLQTEDFELTSRYVGHTIRALGQRIAEGDVAVSPYRYGKRNACTYCSYKSLCGFDPQIEGFRFREIEALTEEEALARVRQTTTREEQ